MRRTCSCTSAARPERVAETNELRLSVFRWGLSRHGLTSGYLLTLIASARLHRLDPEVYLRDVFRVLPHWPRDRYLELAPRYWRITRARLRPDELESEVGWLTMPEPPLPTMPAINTVPEFVEPPAPAATL